MNEDKIINEIRDRLHSVENLVMFQFKRFGKRQILDVMFSKLMTAVFSMQPDEIERVARTDEESRELARKRFADVAAMCAVCMDLCEKRVNLQGGEKTP